jgi:hypothetical protein
MLLDPGGPQAVLCKSRAAWLKRRSAAKRLVDHSWNWWPDVMLHGTCSLALRRRVL